MVRRAQENLDNQTTGAAEPQFGIQRIYVKDLSVEVPHSPAIFLENWEPKLQMDLKTSHHNLENNNYEVVLTITVDAKLKNDKTAFLVELHQGGIFSILGFSEEQLPSMLYAYCPTVLFPYAREVISDAVVRAGFPYLYLSPVNFDSIFHEQMEQKKKEEASAGNTDSEKDQ